MPDSLLEIPGSSFDALASMRIIPARSFVRLGLAALCLSAALATSGCLFESKKKPRPFIPPAVTPAPVIQKPVPMVDSAPELTILVPPVYQPPESGNPNLAPPPKPSPPPRRPIPATPTPAKPIPAPEPPPAGPRITQLFSPQELSDYTRSYDDSMGRVERAVNDLLKKPLSRTDRDTVDQIRSFATQAKQSHDQGDLLTAVNLAKRADVLASDLLSRLR